MKKLIAIAVLVAVLGVLFTQAGLAAFSVSATQTITQEIVAPPSGGVWWGGVSALRLYDLTVENIAEDSADILWTTSRASTSQVTYWSSPELTIKDESYVREHLVCLEDLEGDTTYYFKMTCKDRYGLRKSDEGEFITLKEIVPEPEPIPPEPEEPVAPEPTEPIEPEPISPPATPEKPTPWPLIGGIVGGAILIAAGVIYWLRRRGIV
ncbi:hypothetical protein ES708_27504 [subsurface metagenome]